MQESGKGILSEMLGFYPFKVSNNTKKHGRMLFHITLYLSSEQWKVYVAKNPFSSRYSEILENHQICKKENGGSCGWRIPCKD